MKTKNVGMKKIMFNDDYGLTQAVIDLRKTMTRRVCKECRTGGIIYAKDVVSLRMYSDENLVEFVMNDGSIIVSVPRYKVGEVVAVAQSYKSVFEESLSYAIPRWHWLDDHIGEKGFENKMFVRAEEMPHQIQITDVIIERYKDISEDYLIDDICGKGTWKSNPCVFVYSFKLIK